MAGGTWIVSTTAHHWLVVLCAGQDAVCAVDGNLAPLTLFGSKSRLIPVNLLE